ncbi:MAG: serine/threonine-protein kinase [Planctomycetota bacterium]
MSLSVEDLCGLIKRSRLVTYEEIHAIYDRWNLEAKDKSTSTTHFTRWLIAQEILTDYQAALVAKGMVDDFFLGDYTILERVGRGRMAGVYKARHVDGRIVAIKVLPPSRTKISALMARFQREAALAVTFVHPNVVRSFEFGETNGHHFLVMEMLDGETVEEVLQRRKRLPPAEAVNVIYQALMGLQHLAEHDVVHRDLKPSNLMLVPSIGAGEPDTTIGKTVKILDIGLARKMFEEQIPAEKIDPSEVTREGVLLGTPDYLSPEQARDPRTIDIRSDIYSLGCVLYHLITGQTPFPDSNLLNLMLRHAGETPKPLREFVPDIPEGIQQILTYMTAKQADQRYPTPARAAGALQAFLLADASPSPTGGTTIDALPLQKKELDPAKPRKNSSAQIPTARAIKASPKFAKLASKAPLGKPHAAPAQLPEHIELVPLGQTGERLAAPIPQQQSLEPSPFAAPSDEVTDEETIAPRPRRVRKSPMPLILGICIAALATGIAVAVMLIFQRG